MSIHIITRSAYWCEHPELFAAIADQNTEEQRTLAVVKWFIVSIYTHSSTYISDLLFRLEHSERPIYV